MRIGMVLFLGSLFFFGCSSSLTPYGPSYSSRMGEITEGESSQQDVRGVLGNPDWIEINEESSTTSSQVWAYVDYNSFITPPTVFPDLSHPNEPGWYGPEDTSLGELTTIYISYTDEGIVQNVSISNKMRGLLDFSSRETHETHNGKGLHVRPFSSQCC